MKSDLDKYIGRHLKDREFKIYFERAEVKRKIAQEIAEFTIKLPVKVKRQAKIYISRCSVLDLYSQGGTEEEAKKNVIEAIRLFIVSCFEKGTLDAVLKECGFKPIKK